MLKVFVTHFYAQSYLNLMVLTRVALRIKRNRRYIRLKIVLNRRKLVKK